MQKNADGSIDVYFGPKGACWPGVELHSHRCDAPFRSDVPALCADQAVVREGVAAAGDIREPVEGTKDHGNANPTSHNARSYTGHAGLQVIDEDHYARHLLYEPGRYTYTKKDVGTRYMFAAVRTLIDPANPDDLKNVHALQDAMTIEQPDGVGTFEKPRWDEASRNKVKTALQALGGTLLDLKRALGLATQWTRYGHLIGVATGWGGNPDEDAVYLNVTPRNNDGRSIYRLTVKDVGVVGFWSISVYNGEGHFVQTL